MPNWTSNTLTLVGDADKIDAFYEMMGDEFDFGKIVPPPGNLFTDDLGDKERKMCEEEGIPNWRDWNCEHWGTKWNATNEGPVEIKVYSETTKEATYVFNTAWDTPQEVIRALWDNWPELDFEGGYIHEGYEGCGNFQEFNNRE